MPAKGLMQQGGYAGECKGKGSDRKSDSKNPGCYIRGLKYRLFMARSHFSKTTAAIKTLDHAISGSKS